MLYVPGGFNNFAWRADSIGTTRPAGALGATVTPGNNSKGSYAQVMTALARDAFGLLVCINSNVVSAAARDAIVDIGVDPAGGTSYSILIPNLLGSCAAALTTGAIWYYFPIWIRSGSTVGARASVNNATVGTLRVRRIAFGSPRDRSRLKVGTKVSAYGITAASSSGTAVTSGTTSEGAWTSLGTSSARHWWWQLGMGVNDATMAALLYFADLGIGDASNKFAAIENQHWNSTSGEALYNEKKFEGCEYDAPSGVNVYGRLQCSGTADSALSLAAYGLGG